MKTPSNMEGPFETGPSVSRLGEHCTEVVQVKYLVMSKFLKAGSQNLGSPDNFRGYRLKVRC